MSSLKYFDFTNHSQEEIINKYEEVLYSREIQVTDLSMELGKIQESNEKAEEKINFLEEENNKLTTLVKRKDYFLNEELKSKEVIFMKLQDKENECDELREKLRVLNSNSSIKNTKEIKPTSRFESITGYLFGKQPTPVKASSTIISKELQNSESKIIENPQIQNEPIKQMNSLQVPDDDDNNEIVNEKQENIKDKEKKELIEVVENDISQPIQAENVISKSTKSLDKIKALKNKKKQKQDEIS